MDLRSMLMGPTAPITLLGPDGKPRPFTNDELAVMPHADLLQLRKVNQDQNAQNLLSNYEHRAAAREAGSDNPLTGLSYGAAAPMYQLAKALPRSVTGLQSRSSPSLAQMNQGLVGAGEGIVQGIKNWWQR